MSLSNISTSSLTKLNLALFIDPRLTVKCMNECLCLFIIKVSVVVVIKVFLSGENLFVVFLIQFGRNEVFFSCLRIFRFQEILQTNNQSIKLFIRENNKVPYINGKGEQYQLSTTLGHNPVSNCQSNLYL